MLKAIYDSGDLRTITNEIKERQSFSSPQLLLPVVQNRLTTRNKKLIALHLKVGSVESNV